MDNRTIMRNFTGKIFLAVLFLNRFYFIAGPVFSQDSQEKKDFDYGQKLVDEGLYDLSVIQFQRFVTHYPSSPRCANAQFLMAESQVALKAYPAARECYLKTILGYPVFPRLDQCQFRIGECFEKEGKTAEALESYYRVYLYYPKSKWKGEGLYRSAKLAEALQYHEKAESMLRLLLELGPAGEMHSKVLFLLSDVVLAMEEYQRAVEVLAPLAARPVLDGDAARALWSIGKIYEMQGRFEESLAEYEKAAASKQADLQGMANAQRGKVLRSMGRDLEAMSAFDKALPALTDEAEKDLILRAQAEMAFDQGKIQTALAMLDRIGGKADPAMIYLKGRCQEGLKNFRDAEQIYSSMMNDPSVSSEFRKKSTLSNANICIQNGRFEQAVLFYNGYLNSFPDDVFADAVLFQKGMLYLDSLDLTVDAGIVFQTLWEKYPNSPFVPKSRLIMAEQAAESGRFDEARRLFKTIADRYPCTQWADQSLREISRLAWSDEIRAQDGFSDLSVLLLNRDASLFRLGCVFFQKLKRYPEALQCFERVFTSQPQSPQADSACYFSGLCYEALSQTGMIQAGFDSAQSRYRFLLASFPESPLVPAVLLKWTQRSDQGMPLARDISLTELGKRYPRLQDDADFIYAVGTSAQECDSSLKALSFFRDLADRFPQSPLAEEALYQSAMLQLKLGKTRSADSLFSLYSKMAPRGRFNPSALITRAKMAPPESAIPLLEDLRSRFGYSVLADSGGTLLGDLYLDVKRFKDAAALFEEMVRRDSLSAVGESVGLKMPYGRQSNSAYLKWANACENLGQFKKARQLYLRYGRRASASGDRGNLYAALSRMCEKQDNLVQAASYLGLAADVQPSDSIFHALGSFYFRSGHYAEAVTAWNRGIELTSRYSMKSLLKAKLLIAEIRQDRTVQMETRIKEFEKTFNNDPTIKELTSELNLELAKSYTRQKDFDLALKCIKEVQRNKDSAFYPESEVETGKILLITNKIDKALELLTDLPRKYPKHPILGAVYLNLGDHYFRSQQFDNSLSAFKKAASDTADKTVSATAMRYLIKIYDALQMWDAALATTRRYIQRFPKAEDILEKRIQIGVFSANVKEYFVALDAFHDAQKDATDDTEAEIQYWIGKCYYEMGQFEEAVLEFLKVKYVSKPTQLPWAATALYEAGTTYMRMKNRDNARKMFQKIVTSEGPASDLGRIAVKRIQEIDGGGP